VSNDAEAAVLDMAAEKGIDFLVIDKQCLREESFLDDVLLAHEVDLIVLAGFLWLIPQRLIELFPDRIINIHPALLPKYGGKGMYGMKVHRAVKAAAEEKSGITIHYINERYDEGEYIFQKSVDLDKEDSPEEIASKVLKLEHYHFPRVIEKLLKEF
jgi:phosphoribosylglycinamide formyltransferase-1